MNYNKRDRDYPNILIFRDAYTAKKITHMG